MLQSNSKGTLIIVQQPSLAQLRYHESGYKVNIQQAAWVEWEAWEGKMKIY